jgi:hypothetical protein
MAHALTCPSGSMAQMGQSHSPSGDSSRPTHPKWNHSTPQWGESQQTYLWKGGGEQAQ